MAGKTTIPLKISTPNKDVTCSFEWAKAHLEYNWAEQREMSIHEWRVLLRTMEIVSAQMDGKLIKDYLYRVEPTLQTYEITMPLDTAFFKNLTTKEVDTELKTLLRRVFGVKDEATKTRWFCTFIEHPKVNEGEGTFSYGIYKPFAEVLLNFTHGFRRFEINKALALPTPTSVLFYIRVSGGGDPFYYTVEELKKWLGINPDSYKDKNGNNRIDHIEERVLRPAKKALDEICPWTFTYTKRRENEHNSRSKVIGFTFIPIEQPQFRDSNLEKNSLLAHLTRKNALGEDIQNILEWQLKWPKDAVKRNINNIDEAKRVLGKEKTTEVVIQMVDIWRKRNAENPAEYNDQIRFVIGMLKKEVWKVDPTAFGRQQYSPATPSSDKLSPSTRKALDDFDSKLADLPY